MKVAVIFTGFFRTFHYVKHTFKDFIMDPLDADIFFSAPQTLFTLPHQECQEWVERCPYHSANDKLISPDVIDFFGDKLKSYELIDYKLDPYKYLCNQHSIPYYTNDGVPTFRILSQLSSKELSMKVFKKYVEDNNLNYDLIIMARGDTKYFTPFNLDLVDFDKIGYPSHNRNQKGYHILPPNCPPSGKIPKTFNDQFLIGSQKNMLAWCDIAEKSFDYFKEGVPFTAENMMAYHLMKNNIDWYGSNYIEYSLWRHEEYE